MYKRFFYLLNYSQNIYIFYWYCYKINLYIFPSNIGHGGGRNYT